MRVGPVPRWESYCFRYRSAGFPRSEKLGFARLDECARDILAPNGIYINSMRLCQFATIGERIVKARRKHIFSLGLSRLPKVWLVVDPGVGYGGEELRWKEGDVSQSCGTLGAKVHMTCLGMSSGADRIVNFFGGRSILEEGAKEVQNHGRFFRLAQYAHHMSSASIKQNTPSLRQ
jgi:hypothetical protein